MLLFPWWAVAMCYKYKPGRYTARRICTACTGQKYTYLYFCFSGHKNIKNEILNQLVDTEIQKRNFKPIGRHQKHKKCDFKPYANISSGTVKTGAFKRGSADFLTVSLATDLFLPILVIL